MKKQWMASTLVLICVLLVTACGNTQGGSSSTKDDGMKDKEMVVETDATMMDKDAKTMDEDATMMDEDSNMIKEEDKMMDDSLAMDDVKKTMVENPAPDFVFTDLEGNTVALTDFKDKPVYVKFWASWCTVCLGSLPEVDELSAMDNDFEVITVVAPGFSGEKNAEDFKAWYEKKGYENITVLLDDKGTYMKQFGVRAFPSSAYIDENGGLIKFEIGHSANEKVIEVFQK